MQRAEKTLYLACAIFITGIFIAYVGAIPNGYWQDEYYNFARIRTDGFAFTLERLLTWSPRPLSEILVYLYAKAVLLVGSPLIGAALTFSWLMMSLGAVVFPIAWATRYRALVGLAAGAVVCLLLLGHPTGEMYYWPMASFAYLPAVAAICALLWLCTLCGLASRRTRNVAVVLLLTAVASIEIGALLVVAIVAGVGLSIVLRRKGTRPRWNDAVWLTLPLFASLGIFLLIFMGRLTHGNELMGSASLAHHLGPAFSFAIPEFFKEMFVPDRNAGFNAIAITLATVGKILAFMAFYQLGRIVSGRHTDKSSAYWLTILAFAFAVTAFLTIPASLYQFGALCCERHDTLRQCLILLSLIAAACAFGIKRGPAATESTARCITYIGLSVAISSVTSIGALVHDYSRYGQFHSTYAKDWSSAQSTGPTMLFKVPAPGEIVGAPPIKDGVYSPNAPAIRGNLWWIGGTFNFFHKEKLIIETAHAK